jgi:hypothetical protein
MTGIWQSISTASKGFGEALQGLGAVVGDGHVRRQLLQQALRHALIHRVVLDQQDAAAAEGGMGRARGERASARPDARRLPVSTWSRASRAWPRMGLKPTASGRCGHRRDVVLGAEQRQQHEGQRGVARIGAQRASRSRPPFMGMSSSASTRSKRGPVRPVAQRLVDAAHRHGLEAEAALSLAAGSRGWRRGHRR